jgi:MoCo/4Fe-4S cofactor protein with predicted Tat translocation signal
MSSLKDEGTLAETSDAASTARPRFWRSFAELNQSPEFRALLEREFAAPPETLPADAPERRTFLKLMGASLGLAGVGCRWKEDKLLPLTRRPEGAIPGASKRYATVMELDGVGVGLHVTSVDGRPIKVDGNPVHPESLGGANAMQQASVLGLYDPDRSDRPMRRAGGTASPQSLEAFTAFVKGHFGKLERTKGFGLRVLSEPTSSPTLLALKAEFMQRFPAAKWTTYAAASNDGPRAGSVMAFGRPHRAILKTDAARVILTLDADLFSSSFPGHLAHSRHVANGRRPDGGEMSRIYSVECGYSLIGSYADHRLGLRTELVKAFAAALDSKVSALAKPLPELGTAQAMPQAAFLAEGKIAKFLDAVAKDLVKNTGKSLVVAGPSQPAAVHALAHRLNAVLGNVGRTVEYAEDPLAPQAAEATALKQLADELSRDRVDTLLIIGGNPAYDAPGDLGFDVAMARAKTSVHLSLYDDETSQRATWHVNAAHYLESWGDARAWDGTVSLQQPLIAPLWNGVSAIELLALVLGKPEKAFDLVKATHAGLLPDAESLRRAIHDGVVQRTAFARVAPALTPIPALTFTERELGATKLGNGQLEVTFVTCPKVHDGRFANNGWLQELPAPLTHLSWDNAAMISAATGAELGIKDGAPCTVTVNGKSVTLPAMWVPGHADGAITLTLGYGRNAAGQVGGAARSDVTSVGVNAHALRSSASPANVGGGSIARSNAELPRLSVTTHIHAIDPIGKAGVETRMPELLREATLEEFKQNPDFVADRVHHPPLLNLWQDPVSYEGHKWGMAIDLNKCMGCSACVTACQAENNIPVVGKENVAKGREMLWLRVDRYYKGEAADAQVSFQPIPCQQCENAPCEQVCPVGATMHSQEGLNDMVYNRCIGTRYCSNNCPYKVRRFNYFNYNVNEIGLTPFTPTDDPKMKVKSMVFNPEVTVRSRGVMEKCTFCVQRIQNAKIKAKNVKRGIPDGEIRTACQETCPAGAIVFGNLNDDAAEVTSLARLPRAYALLGELNNRPRVRYLGRVRNPNPELA